ncbi:MAG TPA: hypothetical protein VE054_14825, partial [Blattabacteriaceae bacterium]|nr:hypothetical protein [Blattabacteriaceae bacterium]
RHGPKFGIAGTPMLPPEAPARSADIVVAPLQSYTGTPIGELPPGCIISYRLSLKRLRLMGLLTIPTLR